MAYNLNMPNSRVFVISMASKIDFLSPENNGEVVKLKSLIELYLIAWRNDLPRVGELLGVLWAYQVSINKPTGEPPFALAYGIKAATTNEMHVHTLRSDFAN